MLDAMRLLAVASLMLIAALLVTGSILFTVSWASSFFVSEDACFISGSKHLGSLSQQYSAWPPGIRCTWTKQDGSIHTEILSTWNK